jgi:cell filamentation protein
MKYELPDSQKEILPNLLGIESIEALGLSEFEGFLKAEIMYTEKLTTRTKFSVSYILRLHKLALGHLYSFAGELRSVNMSKAGFVFAAARYLPQTVKQFDKEILSKLPDTYTHKDDLIKDIALVHGELLFIHPFREGNGRTARIIANLMSRKQGYDALRFDRIDEKKFPDYIAAVQKSAAKEYDPMIDLIQAIFPA